MSSKPDSKQLSRSPILVAASQIDQARLAASLLLASIRATLLEKECFNLVISGGSTPVPFFRHLADEGSRIIDWKRVRFFWADERDVPPDHPQSNFRLASENLLEPLEIPASNIFRIPAKTTPRGDAAEAAEEYERTLRGLFQGPPDFDYVSLGLGDDGHTASLFPDAREDWMAAERDGRWVAAPWVPHLNAHRITLLPGVLNQGMKVCFLVSGAGKAKILRAVLSLNSHATGHGSVPYPAQLIHSRYGKAFWLVDFEAASELGTAQAA